MSVFVLKILALASMVIDHTGYFLRADGLIDFNLYLAMRSIGRIAFPVYCFLLVNGFDKTSDRQRYLARLTLFAVLSQLPFDFLFTNSNYYTITPSFSLRFGELDAVYAVAALFVLAVYVWLVKRDISVLYVALFLLLPRVRLTVGGYVLLSDEMNVFYTLAISLAAMAALEGIIRNEEPLYKAVLKALAVVVVVVLLIPDSDYAYKGFALLMALYLCRGSRWIQAGLIGVWCVYMYSYRLPYMLCALLCLLPVLLYNGKKGPAMKIAFYAIYPLHLLALGILNIFI